MFLLYKKLSLTFLISNEVKSLINVISALHNMPPDSHLQKCYIYLETFRLITKYSKPYLYTELRYTYVIPLQIYSQCNGRLCWRLFNKRTIHPCSQEQKATKFYLMFGCHSCATNGFCYRRQKGENGWSTSRMCELRKMTIQHLFNYT